MDSQLIKKNCTTGEYSNLYPVTIIDNVIDPITGKTLRDSLEQCNHLYLPFKDNSKAVTRNQVPLELRRKGLWITYNSCAGKIITEYYKSDDFSNREWGKNENWVPYLNSDIIRTYVEEALSWYKA